MKLTIRKICSAALVFAMILSCSVSAFAGEVSWSGTDEYYYVATTTRQTTNYVISRYIPDASIKDHVYGQSEMITWPTGNYVSYFVQYPSTLSAYAEKLDNALYIDGLARSATSNVPGEDFYVLSPALPSGRYTYGVEVTTCDVVCTITRSRDAILYPTAWAAAFPYATGTLEKAVVSMTACKLIPVEE